MEPIRLTLLGEPVPKARVVPRVGKKGQRYSYTPHATTAAMDAWRNLFNHFAYQPFPPKTALHLQATFYLTRPQSLPKRIIRPVSRPDRGNYTKLVEDALEGFAYQDDACIVDSEESKRFVTFPDQPRTEIIISEAT